MKYVEWFKHDNNARNDQKLQELRRKKGYGAKAIYWDLVEMLHEARGVLPIEEAAYAVSDLNHIPNTSLAKYIICESGLFVLLDDGVSFSSKRLMDDIAHAQKVKERRSEAGRESGRARREKREGGKNKTNDEQMLNKCSTNVEQQSLISPSLIVNNNNNDNKENSIDKSNNYMTIEEMVNIWNIESGSLPKARTNLSTERKKKASLRIKEFGKTAQEQVETMRDITQRLAKSAFANGNNSHGWRADFGWVIANSENWVKVVEGRYDNNIKDIRDIKDVNSLWKE